MRQGPQHSLECSVHHTVGGTMTTVKRSALLCLSLATALLTFAEGVPSAKAQQLRVAVKTTVPLSSQLVDGLAGYGRVTRQMTGLGILDMQVDAADLQALSADARVQFVELDHPTRPLTNDDFSLGLSAWQLDM